MPNHCHLSNVLSPIIRSTSKTNDPWSKHSIIYRTTRTRKIKFLISARVFRLYNGRTYLNFKSFFSFFWLNFTSFFDNAAIVNSTPKQIVFSPWNSHQSDEFFFVFESAIWQKKICFVLTRKTCYNLTKLKTYCNLTKKSALFWQE